MLLTGPVQGGMRDNGEPAHEAARATLREVWKKSTAMTTVRNQPRMPIVVPDCFKQMSPAKIRMIGRTARKNWSTRSTGIPLRV
jgi:hypothetical protein